jgi:hypothetical protein
MSRVSLGGVSSTGYLSTLHARAEFKMVSPSTSNLRNYLDHTINVWPAAGFMDTIII